MLLGENLSKEEIRDMREKWRQELSSVIMCKQEMAGIYFDQRWKNGNLIPEMENLSWKYKIGYIRDILALTVRYQIEHGIEYPDVIKRWAIDAHVQIPKPECGTWAIDAMPIFIRDCIHWISQYDWRMDYYEVHEALKRIWKLNLDIIERNPVKAGEM